MGGSALSTKNTVGTYHWMAPEVLRGENGVTEKCDVFSVGVILCESVFFFPACTLLCELLSERSLLVLSDPRSRSLAMKGEIATNTEPWKEIREPIALVSIVALQNKRLPIPADLQPELNALITDCWNDQAELRPTMQEVMDRLSLLNHITPINEGGQVSPAGSTAPSTSKASPPDASPLRLLVSGSDVERGAVKTSQVNEVTDNSHAFGPPPYTGGGHERATSTGFTESGLADGLLGPRISTPVDWAPNLRLPDTAILDPPISSGPVKTRSAWDDPLTFHTPNPWAVPSSLHLPLPPQSQDK